MILPELEVPKDLCWKFRNINSKTLKLLISKKVWFSSPLWFNDPFDTPIQNRDSFFELCKHVNVGNYEDLNSIHEKASKMRNYYYIFCTNKKFMENAEPYRNNLMWGHYADGHRGICIGFRESDIKESMFKVFGLDVIQGGHGSFVIYDDEEESIKGHLSLLSKNKVKKTHMENLMEMVSHMSLFGKDKEQATPEDDIVKSVVESLLFFKDRCWKYEDEHRYILFDGTAFQLKKPPQKGVSLQLENESNLNPISSIIFGAKTSDEDKKIIHSLFTPHHDGTSFFQAKTKENSIFELDFERYA